MSTPKTVVMEEPDTDLDQALPDGVARAKASGAVGGLAERRPASTGAAPAERRVRRTILGRLGATVVEVFASRGRRVGFLLASTAVSFLYTLLLPFAYTQRFSFANWHYLSTYLLVWSVALGIGMGFVLTVQLYAGRRVAASTSGAVSGVALVASTLPSLLCCTPVIPTVLAFVGVSAVGIYGTAIPLQHFFATHETDFFLGSLALLTATSVWGLHRVASAACLADDGCSVDPDLSTGGSSDREQTAALGGDGSGAAR